MDLVLYVYVKGIALAPLFLQNVKIDTSVMKK